MSSNEQNSTPNFSIILPGRCNCTCGFCFWKYEKSPNDWLAKLKANISILPAQFRRCSVSGGEPTLSPLFIDALRVIRESRDWDAVVLTSNGIRLLERRECFQYIDHLNLSWHHHDPEQNAKVFGGKPITSARLVEIREAANADGVDVNLNCVLCGQFNSREEVEAYIAFAKAAGVQSVCFRQDQALNSTDRPREMQWFSDIKAIGGWACPSCKLYHQFIDGMKVAWKSAIAEPSLATGTVYELVYHQNGVLSSDWQGTMPYMPTQEPNTTVSVGRRGSWAANCAPSTGRCGF